MIAALHRVGAANVKEYKLNFNKQAAKGNLRKPFEKRRPVLLLTKGGKLLVSLEKRCVYAVLKINKQIWVLKESEEMSSRQKLHSWMTQIDPLTELPGYREVNCH